MRRRPLCAQNHVQAGGGNIAILENNREVRCCVAACHSRGSGNPGRWIRNRVDYVVAVPQTLKIVIFMPRRASFLQKFRGAL